MITISLLAQTIMVFAGLLLAVLVIDVVSALPQHGAWGPFMAWAGIGSAAVGSAIVWRAAPMPVALLVMALSLMLWRQRHRLVWAAEKGLIL